MTGIHVAALVSALILVVEHYFPWGLLLRRRLPRLAAYVLGVLALVAPLSVLYGMWAAGTEEIGGWMYLGALWAVIGAGGGAVLICYLIDHLLERINQSYELAELVRLMEARREGPDQGD